MIKLDQLGLNLGGRVLLENANAAINAGERVAIIGANGCGKSSLFKVLQGALPPDHGHCDLPRSWCLSYLAQEVIATDQPAIDYVLDGDGRLRELERSLQQAQRNNNDAAIAESLAALDNYQAYQRRHQAEELMAGLGFKVADFSQPLAAFSGGWRVRLSLARALICPADLLLLDEPTNHLDLHSCHWLAGWLRQVESTVIFVSHDCDFIDQVATRIVSFEQKRLVSYSGNYSQYESQRHQRQSALQASHQQQQKRREQLQAFVTRFKAKASKARQAQSRIKMLQKMTLQPLQLENHQYDFVIPSASAEVDALVTLEGADVGYAESPVLKQLSLSITADTRVGLLGVNGSGKSTLIKALIGELPLLAGTIRRAKKLRVGYFGQHQVEALDLTASPRLHLARCNTKATDQAIKDFLGRFGFSGPRAEESVEVFSGGERARLTLAIIAWQQPNLLLLDEPTNHLDLEMRRSLNHALQHYSGALVIISHDRYLLSATADHFWLVANQGVTTYDGDLDDYFRSLLSTPKKPTVRPEVGSIEPPSNKKIRR